MKTSEQQAIFAIVSTLSASYIYFLILNRMNAVKCERNHSIIVLLYFARKLAGFILLGIIPAFLAWLYIDFRPLEVMVKIRNSGQLWEWLIIISILLILLNLINARSPDLRKMYPEMRLQHWDIISLIIAVGGWILYLTGYEFLFRGILLFNCIKAFGVWPSITLNIALYSSLHLNKGLKEAIAAIPFGLLLCYITLESSSILPAILIHSVQAISAEISCIYQNKEMTFSPFKNLRS
jgi:membrane protease YdiL (CAAX protease family)